MRGTWRRYVHEWVAIRHGDAVIATWLLPFAHMPAAARLSEVGDAQLRNAQRFKAL